MEQSLQILMTILVILVLYRLLSKHNEGYTTRTTVDIDMTDLQQLTEKAANLSTTVNMPGDISTSGNVIVNKDNSGISYSSDVSGIKVFGVGGGKLSYNQADALTWGSSGVNVSRDLSTVGTITGSNLSTKRDGSITAGSGGITSSGLITGRQFTTSGDITGGAITGTSLSTTGGSTGSGTITGGVGGIISGGTITGNNIQTTGGVSGRGAIEGSVIKGVSITTTDSGSATIGTGGLTSGGGIAAQRGIHIPAITLATATKTLKNQGAYLGWNMSNGIGETNIINNRGSGGGGIFFDQYNGDNSYDKRLGSFDGSGNFNVKGKITPGDGLKMSDKLIQLRSDNDVNHGIQFGGNGWGSDLSGSKIDGPIVFGFAGGGLGSTNGGNKIALQWDASQNVTVQKGLTIGAAGPFKIAYGSVTPGQVNSNTGLDGPTVDLSSYSFTNTPYITLTIALGTGTQTWDRCTVSVISASNKSFKTHIVNPYNTATSGSVTINWIAIGN